VTARRLARAALLAGLPAAGAEGLTMPAFDLQVSHRPPPLPVEFESLHVAALGARLHVVGLDGARRACHVAVDVRGQVMAPRAELPLVQLTGLAACSGLLVAAGVTSNGRPAVLGLDGDGQVEWAVEVPAGAGRLQHWPRPVCVAGRPWLFSTTSRPQATFGLTELAGPRLGRALSITLADDTDALDVLGDAHGLVVARVHGDPPRLEIVRLEGDRPVARRDVDAKRPTAPALARVGDRIALGWVTEPGEPHLQWFDGRLQPQGDPEDVSVPPRSGTITRLVLIAAAEGSLAVFFHGERVAGDGREALPAAGEATRREPRRARPLLAALYDVGAGRVGPAQIVEADAKLFAGEWLGDVLAVVHRGADTRMSLLTPRARTSP
jgi:hypothetical protein